MSREPLSLPVPDISAFARTLRGMLAGHGDVPSHLELLNMLARSAGWRNFQHFRADDAGAGRIPNHEKGRLESGSVRAADDSAPRSPEQVTLQTGAAVEAPPAKTRTSAASEGKALSRLKRYFDGEGRMLRWPAKHSQVEPCLWVIWSRLPAGETLDEIGINMLLKRHHLFDDHALLRRALSDYGMVSRTPDGRQYRRIEQRPPAGALELIQSING
ncbi:MAG: DUF2087 domain-containing protein [Thermodesulfobacteriota bacterium]|jgi:hypothetical protein